MRKNNSRLLFVVYCLAVVMAGILLYMPVNRQFFYVAILVILLLVGYMLTMIISLEEKRLSVEKQKLKLMKRGDSGDSGKKEDTMSKPGSEKQNLEAETEAGGEELDPGNSKVENRPPVRIEEDMYIKQTDGLEAEEEQNNQDVSQDNICFMETFVEDILAGDLRRDIQTDDEENTDSSIEETEVPDEESEQQLSSGESDSVSSEDHDMEMTEADDENANTIDTTPDAGQPMQKEEIPGKEKPDTTYAMEVTEAHDENANTIDTTPDAGQPMQKEEIPEKEKPGTTYDVEVTEQLPADVKSLETGDETAEPRHPVKRRRNATAS